MQSLRFVANFFEFNPGSHKGDDLLGLGDRSDFSFNILLCRIGPSIRTKG